MALLGESQFVDKYLLRDVELLKKYEEEFSSNRMKKREELKGIINDNLNEDSKIFSFIIYYIKSPYDRNFVEDFLIRPGYFHTEHFARRIFNAILHTTKNYCNFSYFFDYWEDILIEFIKHPNFLIGFNYYYDKNLYERQIKKLVNLGLNLELEPKICINLIGRELSHIEDVQLLIRLVKSDYSVDLIKIINNLDIMTIERYALTHGNGLAKLCYDLRTDLNLEIIFRLEPFDNMMEVLEYVVKGRGKITTNSWFVGKFINIDPKKFARFLELINFDDNDYEKNGKTENIVSNLNLIAQQNHSILNMAIICMKNSLIQ